MGLVLDIYTDTIYREVKLPVIDNADYRMILRARDYEIKEDIQIDLEVIEGLWKIKTATYETYFKKNDAGDSSLENGRIFQIKEYRIAILVKDSGQELHAFRKYEISHKNNILIGRQSDSDICCPTLKAMSHTHAEIQFEGEQAYIVDRSNNGTYLGYHRMIGKQELHFGDAVNMYGMTVVYLEFILAVNCSEEFTVNSGKLRSSDCSMPEETRLMSETFCLDHHEKNDEKLVHISPRIIPKLYEDTEKLEPAPQKKEGDKKPLWMALLPSVTMVFPMILGYSLMGNNMGMGLTISIGSAVVGFFWANVNLRYSRNEQRNQELERQKRYSKYLIECADRIRDKFQHNGDSLRSMYPSAEYCSQYTEDSAELWTRKRSHSDFLYVRLGLGDMPFQVKITAPETGFSMSDDELSERPEKIAENFKILNNVPLGTNLSDYNVVGLLHGDNFQNGMDLVRVLMTQVAANHSYTDVKIAAIYHGERDSAEQWKQIRWLPHVWNEEKNLRYIASEKNGINDILYALTQILRTRSEKLSDSQFGKKSSFSPYYILFVEEPSMLEGQMITKYLYENGKELGITTVILAGNYEELPSACGMVVEKSSTFSGMYEVKEGGASKKEIEFDHISDKNLTEFAINMSGLRVSEIECSSDIPNSLTFFEMMKIHRLEELNVVENWLKSRTYETMRALVGQKAGGVDCYLDVNEKYHGPHGLLAGTTGSGKSETLQTYILALAARFSPLDVGFFLIDFKGGGMANLFTGLPHIMGQISNLSGNQVRRAMVSIKSENTRRERIFHEFGVKNIDEYTKLLKSKEAQIPMPHLLIIIDEFAELKKEEPEFMQELISVAAVGRSLGVHLILATQKPGNCVDDNIKSNSKFRLCLRVQTKDDSRDMLNKPDAAYLTQAGRCYLQVGSDEVYELFQSGWSGAAYDPSGKETTENAVLIDEQGREMRSGARQKSEKRERLLKEWILEILQNIQIASENLHVTIEAVRGNVGEMSRLSKEIIKLLNAEGMVYQRYKDTLTNQQKLEEVIWMLPDDFQADMEQAEHIIADFRKNNKKLPEAEEITQLDAVVDYLAKVARQHGFENNQQLWMPELPVQLYLEELEGYQEQSIQNGLWKEHAGLQLSVPIGLIDAPANQMQFPLVIDFVRNGHLIVAGGVTSGKSTLLQSMFYAMIHYYSPAEVNLYAIDFSSQMLLPFEQAPHVGGVVMEGEDDKLNKLFGMLASILKERKVQMRGGSFSQYIQHHGHVLPAVVVVIDGYASFLEKTDNRFEAILTELSRDAESYGIYLAISCNGFGTSQLQRKVAGNMRQRICLELNDGYNEILNTPHIDVYPEENVKGRGIALHDGSLLEYQTALSCPAETDYERSEIIRKKCEELVDSWNGKRARKIPEIPKNPNWEQFSDTDEYQSMLAEGGKLPVAYYQEDASLYAIDLSKTYCYLIMGSARSGKSVMLRNIACAARDTGGRVIFLDTADNLEKKTADMVGAEYVNDEDGRFQMIKELLNMTNTRNIKKKQLVEQGLEDEEIYREMKKEFTPVYYFISDMKAYLDCLYTDKKKTYDRIEIILKKGRLLNVFFFASLEDTHVIDVSGRLAYLNFIQEKKGILLGGPLNKQNQFSYQNVRFADQGIKQKPGKGYATNQEDGQNIDLVVIPQNKGNISQ